MRAIIFIYDLFSAPILRDTVWSLLLFIIIILPLSRHHGVPFCHYMGAASSAEFADYCRYCRRVDCRAAAFIISPMILSLSARYSMPRAH